MKNVYLQWITKVFEHLQFLINEIYVKGTVSRIIGQNIWDANVTYEMAIAIVSQIIVIESLEQCDRIVPTRKLLLKSKLLEI